MDKIDRHEMSLTNRTSQNPQLACITRSTRDTGYDNGEEQRSIIEARDGSRTTSCRKVWRTDHMGWYSLLGSSLLTALPEGNTRSKRYGTQGWKSRIAQAQTLAVFRSATAFMQ